MVQSGMPAIKSKGVQWQSHFASICHLFRNHGPFSQAFHPFTCCPPWCGPCQRGARWARWAHLRLAMCRRIMGAMEHDQRGDPPGVPWRGPTTLSRAERMLSHRNSGTNEYRDHTHTCTYYTYMHTCIRAYMHTCIHACMHAYRQTDTHRYTNR